MISTNERLSPERAAPTVLRRYSYGWLTLGLFAFSLGGHWLFGWFAYAEEQRALGQPLEVAAYTIEMLRDTFENWQSEFLQLLWQVGGLAYFLYLGSPQSREGNERLEAKIDTILGASIRKPESRCSGKSISRTGRRPARFRFHPELRLAVRIAKRDRKHKGVHPMGTRFLPMAVVAAGLGFIGTVESSHSAPMTHAATGGNMDTSLVQEVQSSRDYRSNRNRDWNSRDYRRDRTYNRHRHGPRYRYRHGRYRHYHDGYYYANPWWLVPGIIGLGMMSSSNSRCSYWHDRCVENWGYGGGDYYGCMRYYNC